MFEDFSAKERILVVEVNWLGDVLFSTPAIRAIRARFPGAYIAALVVPRCRALLHGNNYLDEVMVLDEEGRHKGPIGKLRLIAELRSRRFDTAYILRASLTRTLCIFLAGIKKRIGYVNKKSDFLLTQKVPVPKGGLHRADIYYYLVAKTKIPDGERHYDFFVSSEDRKFIDGFLQQHSLGAGKRIVVLHVGGNWDLKRWPKEYFADIVDELISHYGADVIISGSFVDHILAKEISDLAKHKPFIACGLTTLKQLGCLFAKSDLVISADSGPLHIAMAMQARAVSLFGPTSPEMTGPFGRGDFSVLRSKDMPCAIPCYNLECKDNICMRSISVQQVLDEVEKRGWLKRLK
ncbi:MAG: lipopolysaccharide heptosyltransferase II [Candidatus Omnitrophica bacterium CG1_02_44_16]|nr:MAG: lipopolysaccharide heptosyltransferase II [Candidatus Omnitrophica bacterium CG1_02_44_16]PIY82567.1 MAG: lipopolysaccharide heptosyltransferase II [Candidatus Omnitrophica bacterium CG_4_10_14_0_8_um_filter_44_12]PIZ83934.1 MAG: lipopolysaccharide heptosyltransferase II [Candidatus Omnitrophica bacterium CG_4_10_14_0_2_um_filter_44_9]